MDLDVRKHFHLPEHTKSTSTIPTARRRSRRPRKCLRVRMPSGQVICEPRAAATFVKALEGLGIQRVHALRFKENGGLLVDTSDNGSSGIHPVQGYYVCTHSSTERKRDVLVKIAEQLGVDLQVEMIPVMQSLDARNWVSPESYFFNHYKHDQSMFDSDMMCGATLSACMVEPRRSELKGLREFVVSQFLLNLLHQAIFSFAPDYYENWRDYKPPFGDIRLCFSGHGMGGRPSEILRFAQGPCEGIKRIDLSWEIIRDYSSFFLGKFLEEFRDFSEETKGFQRDRFIDAIRRDIDCSAVCVVNGRLIYRNVVNLIEMH